VADLLQTVSGDAARVEFVVEDDIACGAMIVPSLLAQLVPIGLEVWKLKNQFDEEVTLKKCDSVNSIVQMLIINNTTTGASIPFGPAASFASKRNFNSMLCVPFSTSPTPSSNRIQVLWMTRSPKLKFYNKGWPRRKANV
jgi:hypothetical protein